MAMVSLAALASIVLPSSGTSAMMLLQVQADAVLSTNDEQELYNQTVSAIVGNQESVGEEDVEHRVQWAAGPRVGSIGRRHCFLHNTTIKDHRKFSLMEAQASCDVDEYCRFVWSPNCEHDFWIKCFVEAPTLPAGDQSSCTSVRKHVSKPLLDRTRRAESSKQQKKVVHSTTAKALGLLTSYWDYESCGPEGDDYQIELCGGPVEGRPHCKPEISVEESVCPSGRARLLTVLGDGSWSKMVTVGKCQYAFYAQYICHVQHLEDEQVADEQLYALPTWAGGALPTYSMS